MFSTAQRFEKIKALQKCPQNIRNICIIAHVDHGTVFLHYLVDISQGKTTLSDCLLSSNNIISKKLAGKLRLLDTRPDEQERRITMKSSAISLIFANNSQEYLINLVDSPGHVEFSSEVASALRLCDGALILVDAIEGVSSRTLHVLKQAFEEKVQTLLVINKVDRLINELKMTPEEAYKHLNVIIDEMNAALSSYIASDIYVQRTQHDEEAQKEKAEQGAQGEQGQSTDPAQPSNTLDIDEKILEELENKVYFSPEKNNVLFASAVDNWCFDVMTFAKMIAEKLGCRAKAIQKYMWGDYYLDLKKKKIYKTPPSSKSKPIFVQYILESLWQVYDTIHSKDTEKMTKIAKSLKIQLPDNFNDLLTKDVASALNFFLWKWLPIDEIILKNVVALLPNPIQSQKIRLGHICKKLVNFEKESKGHSEDTKAELRRIREAVENCDNSPDAPVVIYIAKMINVPKENINEHGLVPFSQMNYESKFVGFARIFSGVLKRGSQVVVISARTKDKADQNAFDKKKDENITAKIDTIYLQYSQYLEGISEISAGNCFAIGDIENALYKTATVSNFATCPSFSPMTFGGMSLLKVAISPKDLNEYPQLVAGLKKLNKSDPSVEIYYNESGDLILSTCGEVHLERCITDLQTQFSKIEVKTSEPIVSFKETIICESLNTVLNNPTQQTEKSKVQYEKRIVDKTEKREKKERTKKALEIEGESSDSGSEVVSDTGVDEEEDKVPESNLIKRDIPKHLVTKNYAKIQLKSNRLNTVDVKKKVNVFECVTPNQRFSVRIRAVALKYEVAIWLETQGPKMRKLFSGEHKQTEKETVQEFIEEFNKKLKESETDPALVELINNHLVSFGPRKYGPNLLLNKFINKSKNIFSQALEIKENDHEDDEEVKDEDFLVSDKASSSKASTRAHLLGRKTKEVLKEYYKFTFEELSNAISLGFDLATNAGPLCEEPMIGVCFIVEDFKFLNELPKIDPQLLAKIEKERERQLEIERERQKEKEREERRQRALERAKRKAEKERLLELEEKRLNDPDYYGSEYEDSEEEEEGAPKTAENGEKTEAVEGENKNEIVGGENKPEAAEGENKTEVIEGENKPEAAEGENKTAAIEGENKPETAEGENKTEIVENGKEEIKPEAESPKKETAETFTKEAESPKKEVAGTLTKETESPTKKEAESPKKKTTGNPIKETETPTKEAHETPTKEAESPVKTAEQKLAEAEATAASEKIKFTKWIMNDPYGPISGQIMSAAKEACLESFMGADPRLVEGVYLCYLQVPVDQIGAVYDVLNRRRSTVVQEEVNEMNYLTLINAHLPVNESFGFYSEMWRKTSGIVNPQLEFDTWRIIEEDPFYVPETEEEMEEWGETGIVHNFAKNLIEKIRKRKGLQTEEKIVVAAEKQRTLARKK